MRARPALFTVAGLVLLAPGCGDIVEPVVAIENRRLAVIPVRDEVEYYFDSERGIAVAELVARRLADERRENPEDTIEVVPFSALVKALGAVDPKDLSFIDIGRRAKADLVLRGEIVKFETRRPGDGGLLRGVALADIAVLDVTREGVSVYEGRIQVNYPPEKRFEGFGALPATEGSEAEVERGLLTLLAARVAELFYVHEPEPD